MTTHGNIRDLGKYAATVWDWSFLNGCFGSTKIRVSDGDGMVERNSHLLLFEAKLPNNPIPEGQRRMFCSLQATGLVTTFVIWGQPNKPAALQCFYPYPGYTTEKVWLTGEDELKGWVEKWFSYANSTGWENSVTKAMNKQAEAALRAYLQSRQQLAA